MSNKKNEEINGSNGNDIILGTAGADLINGNNGDDSITAGVGDDFVHGNNGNDVIEGGVGNDKIYGNAGIDTAIFSGSILDYSWAVTEDDGEGDGDHPDWFEGKVTITDLNTGDGDDGIDTLKHVERLQFNDYVFNVVGNNAPLLIAANSQATDEDTSLTFSLSAFDFDGDVVTASIVAASSASVLETGSTSLTPNMGSGTEFTFSYDPGSLFQYLAVGETANDQVTIEVSDGNGGVSTKVVDVTITGVNDAPTGAATATLADGTEDTPYIVNAADLLAGFSDVDTSDTLSIAGLIASDGTVTNNLDGTFTITPTQNFNGTVTLNYDVVDGNGGSIAASQSYTLAAVNDDPIANNDSGTVSEDGPGIIINLLGNDSDVDLDTLSILSIDTTGLLGTVTDNGDGTVTYNPNGAFESLNNGDTATDSFSYAISDGNGGTSTATVDVAIQGTDDVIASLIDFEDLPAGIEIPDGYHGFNWDVPYGLNLYELDGDTYWDQSSGYAVAGSNVAYTPYAYQPVTITRSDSGDFDFEGVELTSAWDSSQTVTLQGFLDGNLLYSENVTIYNTSVTDVNVNWGAIDTLIIGNSGSHLVLDNFNLINL